MSEGQAVIGAEIERLERMFQVLRPYPTEVLMLGAIRDLDAWFICRHYSDIDIPAEVELVLKGGFEAVWRLRKEIDLPKGTPFFDIDGHVRKACFDSLTIGTHISYLKRVLALEMRGLIKVTVKDNDEILIEASARAGVEALEQSFIGRFYRSKRSTIEQEMESAIGSFSTADIGRELEKVVRLYHEHFIAYHSNEKLQEAFCQMAAPRIASNPLWGFLPKTTKLGRYQYSDFQAGAVALTALALFHVSAAFTLTRAHPLTKLANIVSMPHELDQLSIAFEEICGFDEETARDVISAFVWFLEDQSYQYEWNLYLPPLIQTSPTQVLKPAFTILYDPLAFMLRKLQRTYKADWDRATNTLEIGFRQELYDLFAADRFYCIPNATEIRVGGVVLTDVDAAVLDRTTGTLALYQLKWQLPFWGSIRERVSKAKNFVSGGASWAKTIESALPCLVNNDLNSYFRVPRSQGEIHTIKVFVIGRFFSDFPEVEVDRTSGVTWTSWPQYVTAAENASQAADAHESIATYLAQLYSSGFEVDTERVEQWGRLKLRCVRRRALSTNT